MNRKPNAAAVLLHSSKDKADPECSSATLHVAVHVTVVLAAPVQLPCSEKNFSIHPGRHNKL